MAIVTKIHPAIGIARVGNSAEYYLGPETPGGLPLDPATGGPIYSGPGLPPQAIFHDASGALKKQAARFKVYAYDDTNPADPGTLVEAGRTRLGGRTVTGIEWTVYLANKKTSWFEFRQLTGSGMEGDAGYARNNATNPGSNPLRFSARLGTNGDPATIGDANRRQLVLDPGPLTASGAKAARQNFGIASRGLTPFDITTLGSIFTDADSNLIVLGGEGNSGTTDLPVQIKSYANTPGWFDDVSDGPVTGHLLLDDGSKVAIGSPAWVICGPPGYAPEIFNLVTLYDTMFDVAVRELGFDPSLFRNGQFQTSYAPSLAAEIRPLLARPNLYRYVAALGNFGTSQHAALPKDTPQQFAAAIAVIRNPANPNAAPTAMPKLAGDNPDSISNVTVSNFLTVTRTQFFILSQYAGGVFSTAAPTAPGGGVALDKANLENCVGGAFCPGIEITWISRNPTIYQPLPASPAASDAFRLRHKDLSGGLTLTNGANNDYSAGLEPGDLSKYMAQPWQADFNECTTQPIGTGDYWWWPAQRPYSVFPAADPATQMFWTREQDGSTDQFPDLQMVFDWKNLGFILNIGPAGSQNFVEIERNQGAISQFGRTVAAGDLVAETEERAKGPKALKA
jgi:hypothetical protein